MTALDQTRPTPEAGHLSARERQVLHLIATGSSNAQIAATAGVTINSVKSFVRSAYQKIGVERRVQAVRWAIEHDLDQSPTPSD